ncbi:hypothetical protein ACOBQB_24135 [Streptomyces sp. G5(2025)]|uniref:hypothetical protein n=1 Tax=Streptomyces sp. G5(2025) TaxID=3406628 RepID=UPI003C1B6AEE
MKALLWLVLAAAVAVNISTGLVLDGVQQTLISVGTGVVALGTAVGLYVTRRRDA